jgi:polyisoprenoid-binding protein YceI
MNMKIMLTVSLAVLAMQSFCQKKILLEPAPVHFIIKNAGLKVNGSMSGLNGFIMIDLQNSSLYKIEGTIDPSTIQTGIALRDKHLKKADYFNVAESAKIFMTSTHIKKRSNRKYVGNFDLTIKGIKKSVAIPFTLLSTDNVYLLKGEFSINRLDFNLGERSIVLSDDVTVKIEFKTVSR